MKSTLKIKPSLKRADLLWFTSLFCLASFALLEYGSISLDIISSIKKPLLYLAAACLFFHVNVLVRNITKRRYIVAVLLVVILCFGLCCTLLVDRQIVLQTSARNATLRLVIYVAELFMLMILLSLNGRGEQTLRFLYFYVLVLVLATDFLLLTRLRVFHADGFETYLVGTKFTVMYLHMDLVVLWLMRSRNLIENKVRAKWMMGIALILFAALSLHLDCKTGVLGCVLLYALIVVLDSRGEKWLNLLTSPIVLGAALFISAIFPFVLKGFLDLPAITYLVQTVLKRDLTLTGRTNIYGKYVDAMSRYWLAGYGYGTGNEVCVKLFGYANTQNALLQWILQTGIVNTLLLCMLMVYVFHQVHKSRPEVVCRMIPIVALIYVYIILGVIEITFNMAFIMWFALLFMLVNQRERQPAQQPAA